MAEKIGVNWPDFVNFITKKIEFLVNKNNEIITQEGLTAGVGLHDDVRFWFTGIKHRIRLNDSIPLVDYLKLPLKQQCWSKWRYGLPTDLIPSIRYVHRKYIPLEKRGVFPYVYYSKALPPSPSSLSNQKIHQITAANNSAYFPFGFLDFNFNSPWRWDDALDTWLMVVFFDEYKQLEFDSNNREYIYEPIPLHIMEEIVNYCVPSIVWDGGFYREVFVVPDANGYKILLDRSEGSYKATWRIEAFSDDNKYQIQIFLGTGAIRINSFLTLNFNQDIKQWEIKSRPILFPKTFGDSVGIVSDDVSFLQTTNYGDLTSKGKKAYSDRYQQYLDNYFTMMITEYDIPNTYIDGLIDPLWYGWGPLPATMGFDLSKIEVINDTPQQTVKPSEVITNGGHKEYRWSQSANQLFGNGNHIIPPSTGGNYSSINPRKHYLRPDN